MKVDIVKCARCGRNHNGLEFTELTYKSEPYSHWGTCPVLNEPILLKESSSFTTVQKLAIRRLRDELGFGLLHTRDVYLECNCNFEETKRKLLSK